MAAIKKSGSTLFLYLLKFQVILGKIAPEAFGIFLGYRSVGKDVSVLVFVCRVVFFFVFLPLYLEPLSPAQFVILE